MLASVKGNGKREEKKGAILKVRRIMKPDKSFLLAEEEGLLNKWNESSEKVHSETALNKSNDSSGTAVKSTFLKQKVQVSSREWKIICCPFENTKRI